MKICKCMAAFLCAVCLCSGCLFHSALQVSALAENNSPQASGAGPKQVLSDALEGKETLLETGKKQTFRLLVPEDGTYHLAVSYAVCNEKALERKLLVQINGQEIRMPLVSRWKDAEGKPQTDRFGNELPPKQKLIDEPCLDAIWNQASVSSLPAAFTLRKGEHDITLTAEDVDVRLFHLYLLLPEQKISYSSYQKEQHAAPTGGDFVVMEGEDYSEKNDSSIRAGSVNQPALSPYDFRRRLLNILDGGSFKTIGQKVTYEFEIKAAGNYQIGLRYSQNYKEDLPAHAILQLDGSTLFAEMEDFAFPYTGIQFANHLFEAEGKPAEIFLKPGKHTLSLQLDGTAVLQTVERLDIMLQDISAIGMELKKVAGTSASEYRTWDIESYIPGVTEKLRADQKELMALYGKMEAESGKAPAGALNMKLAADNLEKLLKNPDKIPNQLDLLNEGSSSVSRLLSDQITILKGQNLTIDRIYVFGKDKELPRANAGFFAGLLDSIKRFFSAFFEEKEVLPDSDTTLKVWMNYPIYYLNTLQAMTDTQFTPKTGIAVRFSTMPDQQRLILANATKSTPDVIMGAATKIPFDLGLRGAAKNLMEYPDFPEYIQQEYAVESLTPYALDDKIFGITETQEFYLLAYRTDIFDTLHLTVPETWEDVENLMPVLRRNSMNFYMQLSGFSGVKPLYTTMPLFNQNGAAVFSHDGLTTCLNSQTGLEGFETLTDLYRLYSVQPVVSSFYNSFRYGQIPIGIASYGDYVKIKTAAPEIAGKWKIALHPGVRREDGTIDRATTAASTACAIMEQTAHPDESWTFLKWWLSSEVQSEFGNTLQTTYGPEFLWNSANKKAFEQLAFPEEDKKVIAAQWAMMREIPQHPAQYIVEREISDAWANVVIGGKPARIALDQAASNINREMQRKLEEFGYVDAEGTVLRPFCIRDVEEILKGGRQE